MIDPPPAPGVGVEPRSLPEDLDLDRLIVDALRDPEIATAASAAGVSPKTLREDLIVADAVNAVRSELDEYQASERLVSTQLALGQPLGDAPWIIRELLAQLPTLRRLLRWVHGHPAFRRFVAFLRLVGFGAWSSGEVRDQPDPALVAQRNVALERLRINLAEQLRRQLRTAVQRRTRDSHSTLLKVDHAPGLAELVDDDYSIATRATDELRGLLDRMPGGSIGLAGRRGAGKSTLMQQACPSPAYEGAAPVLAAVVSAPTQYDGREFVLHLFARLCETVLGGPQSRAEILRRHEERAERPLRDSIRDGWFIRMTAALACCGCALVIAGLLELPADPLLIAGAALLVVAALVPRSPSRGWPMFGGGISVAGELSTRVFVLAGVALLGAGFVLPDSADDPLLDAGIIAVIAAIALRVVAFVVAEFPLIGAVPEAQASPFPRDLTMIAQTCLDEIEFQQTVATGWTHAAGGKLAAAGAELSAQAGRSATKTLARTPLTFPEVVERLRFFLREAATHLEVRIGIDELDKIGSEEDAQRFLNEIKGIFGIPRCFFLVSVSEEAMSNFDRRGARLRDVFDSAFDEIVYVPPLVFAESRDLLRARVIGLPIPYLALCHVLSAGLPRDLIRIARALIAAKPPTRDGELEEMTSGLLARELEQRVRAVSVVASGIALEPQTSACLKWAGELRSTRVEHAALLARCAPPPWLQGVDTALRDESARSAGARLADLAIELMVFCYFAATLLACIADVTGDEDALERLVSARAAGLASPRLGWGLVSAVRDELKMQTLELPLALGRLPPDQLGLGALGQRDLERAEGARDHGRSLSADAVDPHPAR